MNFLKPKFWDKNKISLFALLLYPVSLFVKLLFFFKKLFTKANKFSVPIICVGNIYIGGTGKSPFCIELFSILKDLNKNPSFIRKKYESFKDEIALLEQNGKVYEEKKRARAIEKAVLNESDVLILDDGFQDFSIKKDLSIICFSERQWIGNGFTIPSGPLREELSSLKRANIVVINGKKNVSIDEKILEKNSKIKIYYTMHRPKNIEDFKNKKIFAFAGIGNPDNFFDLLTDNKINVAEKRYFPDHFNYSDKQIENLIDKAKKINATLLTTEKDYLRIKENYKKNVNFLKIKSEIQNKKQFIEDITKALRNL